MGHWDSKLLHDTLGLPEHRLAILVSGAGYKEGKLLSVPPVADATGQQQSQATLKALKRRQANKSQLTTSGTIKYVMHVRLTFRQTNEYSTDRLRSEANDI